MKLRILDKLNELIKTLACGSKPTVRCILHPQHWALTLRKVSNLLILIPILFSCDLPEETTKTGDNVILGYAIAFKANECGNYPNYPLFIAKGSATPAKRDVQACGLTIIQQKCPFKDYPYYCLKLFKNFNIETPFSEKEKK